jgi:hypothetical protein
MTELRLGTFDSLIAQPETHVALDLSGDAAALLILFGGIAGGVSMPVFEFFRLTSEMPGKKAFFRDPRRGWYQRGIPGIGDSAFDVRDYLSRAIDRANVDRVVMAGASAGGYAALLFAAWCGADEAIAFSPQTFIDELNRRDHKDARWADQISDLHRALGPDNAWFDLVNVLPADAPKTHFQVHVSTDDALDLVHAHRIADRAGVQIFEHDRGGHRLVKTLRDRGVLQMILLDALRGSYTSDASPTTNV